MTTTIEGQPGPESKVVPHPLYHEIGHPALVGAGIPDNAIDFGGAHVLPENTVQGLSEAKLKELQLLVPDKHTWA